LTVDLVLFTLEGTVDKEKSIGKVKQIWEFLRTKIFKPSVLIPGVIFLILATSFVTGKLIQQRTVFNGSAKEGLIDAASTPTVILADDFERNSFFSSDWTIANAQMNAANFTLVSSGVGPINLYSSDKMLSVANNNEGLQAVVHAFSPALKDGIIRIRFYDYNDDRSAGTVVSINNSFYIQNPSDTKAMGMILQVDHDKTSYTLRSYTEGKTFDVGTRSPGWHTVEFRLMPCGGAYIVLDGQSYANHPINSFMDISSFNIGRVWRGDPGITYFDKLEITNYFVPASGLTNQQLLDSWSDLVYQKYKITGSDPNLFIVPAGENRDITSNNRYRFLADQAQMLLYYYYSRCESNPKKANCDPADLGRAVNIIKAYTNNYEDSQGKPLIGQAWLSTIGMNLNLFNVWWAWKDLDVATKQKFFYSIRKEADFWTWALNEVKTNPNGETIPKIANRRTNNLSFMSATDSTDLRNDTRSEEIPPIAWFLSSASLVFPSDQNSKAWEEAAKCYAWHTYSREPGEIYCGIKTMNITSDYLVGNHGLTPSSQYALAGVTSLQQGQLSYFLAGKSYPSEFEHNIENGTASTVWQKNLTECGCSEPGCFLINSYCHGGQDWGDINFVAVSQMLGHWEQLGKTPQIKSSAGDLLRQVLEHNYFDYKNLYWSKLANKNADESTPLGPYAVHWMKNLELQTQESAKYWVMSNINDADFRSKYFPQKLDICEENFLNRKVWSGEENLIATCDSTDKKDGNYSLKMDSSASFSNVEFYTPLMKANPNTQYKLSYWIKTKDIVKANSDTQTMGKVYPALYKSTAKESDEVNSSNRVSSGFNIGPNLIGTNDWAFKETVFNTTADAFYIRLRVQPGNAAKGIIWVDNVKLESLGPVPLISPTLIPTNGPTKSPTAIPTTTLTLIPTKVPTSTPTPNPISCNTSEVSLGVIPNPVNVNTLVSLRIAGDASTYIGDSYGGGVSGCSGPWNSKTCTSSATAGTYTWTHTWKHCVGDFNHCSNTCSKSLNIKIQ
jgi:hypothetical protein